MGKMKKIGVCATAVAGAAGIAGITAKAVEGVRVPLVKAENTQSGCASHRRSRSFLRTIGSPPV